MRPPWEKLEEWRRRGPLAWQLAAAITLAALAAQGQFFCVECGDQIETCDRGWLCEVCATEGES